MCIVPSPGRFGDRTYVSISGRPTQCFDDPLGAGDKYCRVAGSAPGELITDWASRRGLAGAEHFENTDASPRAEVVGPADAWLEVLDCELVCLRQVVGVYVVADAGP